MWPTTAVPVGDKLLPLVFIYHEVSMTLGLGGTGGRVFGFSAATTVWADEAKEFLWWASSMVAKLSKLPKLSPSSSFSMIRLAPM